MQNGMAVAYASKALTKAQINYAQIEKKNACHCIWMPQIPSVHIQQTNVETDHKLLVSIFKQPIGSARARELLFWLRMSRDIEAIVSRCNICQTFRKSQQKETLIPHETPQRPWQVLGTDLFTWKRKGLSDRN